MIIITIDHSYEDDYFMISDIEVNLSDEKEKNRILKNFEQLNQCLVDSDSSLRKMIARTLGVAVELIDLNTNEIDLM